MLRFQSPSSSISQKFRKRNPLQVPQQGPLWRKLPVSRVFLNYISNIPHESSPDKRNSTLLSKVLEKERTPMFPQTGPL